ncbi:thioredoxin domain-containing protein [Spirosoma lacussanchae]|uniref:thioredoxin domain-containing protein n=1 Tax=Spirosoma lacussanchae TaxID=1884249 RepID=UPI00110A0154|nr:thioredoxin family protein [Spirosoma lacussanchae]
MQSSDTRPFLVPAKTAVLLIFMPSDAESRQQRVSLTVLADSLQTMLGDAVRVLKIDETAHPEVMRSFDVEKLPAFILVRQGIELWRQEGTTTEAARLAETTQQLLEI